VTTKGENGRGEDLCEIALCTIITLAIFEIVSLVFVFPLFWRNVLMQMDNLIPEKTKRRTFMVS